MNDSAKQFQIVRFQDGQHQSLKDSVAVEEPLEIRVVFGGEKKRRDRSLSITMRTPGADRQLAAGFLLGEGIIRNSSDIVEFESTGTVVEGTDRTNQLCVHLREDLPFDFASLQRNFYTTSSCGICGRASLEAVGVHLPESVKSQLEIPADLISRLPDALRESQATFDQTGGLHAAGCFDDNGDLLASFEDVGRHNALDKLIGNFVILRQAPLSERIIVVSGRASFELVQKTIAAGVGVLVAVGAPSSLAVELAAEFGVTLIGFASANRFNVYTEPHRVRRLS